VKPLQRGLHRFPEQPGPMPDLIIWVLISLFTQPCVVNALAVLPTLLESVQQLRSGLPRLREVAALIGASLQLNCMSRAGN